jgi:hypothetical protein
MAVKYNRYKFVTNGHGYGYDTHVTVVLLLKPPCGGFKIESATWIQKRFKTPARTSRKLQM